jgi:drug/metabolite transporter (DMT)-like permease
MRAAVPLPAAPPAAIPLPLPLLVAAFCLIWSSAFAVSRLAILDCPPLTLLAVRCFAAGAIMLAAVGLLRGRRHFTRRDLAIYAALGIANYALYLGMNYVALAHGASAGLAALVSSANPILTAVLAAAVLGEPMTGRKVAGLALGVVGVAVILDGRLSGGGNLVATALLVGALASLVGGTILFKKLAPQGSVLIGNGVQNLAGGLAIAPFAATLENVGDVVPSVRLLVSFAVLVVLASIVVYLLWFHLLTVAGASTASAYHFLMPPLGLMFGWLLLGERAEPLDLIGVLPIALGIWLVTHGAAPRTKATRQASDDLNRAGTSPRRASR